MVTNQPRVGIGLLVIRYNPTAGYPWGCHQILLGRRKNAHGAGEYAGPGGHLEHGETFTQCALRELAEEAGSDLTVSTPEFLCLTNIRRYDNLHYVDIGMVAQWKSGEPQTMEPEKNEGWGWYDPFNPPGQLFGSLPNYINTYWGESGTGFFDNV